MKTILITGINGFLGSNLAKMLSGENLIIGLEFSLTNLFRIKNCNYKLYNTQCDNLNDIFTNNKIDIIIHTATIYSNNNESVESMIMTNVVLPIKLLEFAQLYCVEAFINTDSFFNDHKYKYSYLGEYTLSKRHCLEWLKTINHKTKLINMKLFHMYGPGDSQNKFVMQIFRDLKNNKPTIELTPGNQKRDFIYIDDVVNAYNVVIKNINQILSTFIEFQVGTGHSISIRQFVETAAQITNSRSELLFGALEYRMGEIMLSEADITQLSSFNWQPKISLVEGINETSKY